jgi:hypothetical protein
MESNLLIGHKHRKEIYINERFDTNILWKGIISCLWKGNIAFLMEVHDVLWKGNIAFMWVLENYFISMIVSDSDFS